MPWLALVVKLLSCSSLEDWAIGPTVTVKFWISVIADLTSGRALWGSERERRGRGFEGGVTTAGADKNGLVGKIIELETGLERLEDSA